MKKDELKAYLKKFEANVYGIIYNCFTHEARKMKMQSLLHAEMRNLQEKTGIPDAQRNFLWSTVQNLVKVVSREANSALKKLKKDQKGANYTEKLRIRSEIMYAELCKPFPEHCSIKRAVQLAADSVESSQKVAGIAASLRKERSRAAINRYSPFWLMSYETNSSESHAPYQGRVYYDANWRQYVTDRADITRIEAYIANHKCKTVQEITSGPYYMVTRPNCRHELKALTLGETLTNSAASLLRTHKLIRTNTVLTQQMKMARMYKERLDMRMMLWKIMPNPTLAKDIQSDKRLVKKWSRM